MMNGRVVASERLGHTILEGSFALDAICPPFGCFISVDSVSHIVPNPLGVVGVLTAFNFPVAVYGWYVFEPASFPLAHTVGSYHR